MRNNPFNRLLRNEAHELGDGGGADPAAAAPAAETPAPLAVVPAAPAAAAAPPREPSRLELIGAAIRDKGVILAENTDLKGQLGTLKGTITAHEGTIAGLNARITALETENSQLKQDLQGIDAALKTTTANVVSIDAAAAKAVAKMGFESADLPAAAKEGESIDSMEARLGQETDPQKIVSLARQIDALKAKQTV